MIRVTTFDVPDSGGLSFKIASMSVAEAEAFVEEGKKLLARNDVKPEEWMRRRNATIISSINKANPEQTSGVMATSEMSEELLKKEFDIPTLDALYLAILKFSGLQPGEVTAAADSSKSAAA